MYAHTLRLHFFGSLRVEYLKSIDDVKTHAQTPRPAFKIKFKKKRAYQISLRQVDHLNSLSPWYVITVFAYLSANSKFEKQI